MPPEAAVSLTLMDEKNNFPGTTRNGIESIPFDSAFPLSFSVQKLEESDSQCYDSPWATLLLSVFVTVLISTFITSPTIFFFSIFTIVFFQIALVSDTPDFEAYSSVLQSALSHDSFPQPLWLLAFFAFA
jgi:hypothetical protein